MITLICFLLNISTLTSCYKEINKIFALETHTARLHDNTNVKRWTIVNFSVYFVLSGETYQALVIYEKLLDMYSRLQTDNIECSDVWTSDFIHGLYMNCSIAYKTVGSYDKA